MSDALKTVSIRVRKPRFLPLRLPQEGRRGCFPMEYIREAKRRLFSSKSTLFIFTGRRCEDGCFFVLKMTRDYTVMSNHHLKDRTLTLKSKGLLSMMLSLPDEWNYTTRGLAAICREGVDSIGAALKELENHGYIRRTQLRDEKGKITDTEYVIYEMPQCEPPSSPGTPLPGTAKPYTENPGYGVSRIRRNRVRKNPAQLNLIKQRQFIKYGDIKSYPIKSPRTPCRGQGWEWIGWEPENVIVK